MLNAGLFAEVPCSASFPSLRRFFLASRTPLAHPKVAVVYVDSVRIGWRLKCHSLMLRIITHPPSFSMMAPWRFKHDAPSRIRVLAPVVDPLPSRRTVAFLLLIMVVQYWNSSSVRSNIGSSSTGRSDRNLQQQARAGLRRLKPFLLGCIFAGLFS